MADTSIYKDIAERTGGDIYIGVVGPVRTGKSTFIKKFMETLVIPNIDGEYKKDRATDEMPQSAAGRTIMTTEPKFIPNEAVNITLDSNIGMSVRLIDCVGYIVPSALGYIENENPRMVMTPWFEDQIPFNMAAELGTQKVITEHSTIGLVITTDGSIGEIPREDYIEAERRVVNELKQIKKPFAVLLNTTTPDSDKTKQLAQQLSEEYDVSVIPADCLSIGEKDIKSILKKVLYEFNICQINIRIPAWINSLDDEHWLKQSVYKDIMDNASGIERIRQVESLMDGLKNNEYVNNACVRSVNLGTGCADVEMDIPQSLFYRVITESTGMELENDGDLINLITTLSASKQMYDRFASAMEEAEAKGYGIVTPGIDELSLEEPQIVRQGSRFGVRLKASAPSYHIIKADIQTEVSPIVGSEKQSEDLVRFLLTEFEDDPKKIWDSNIFGKTLHELVNEGLHTKLSKMPDEARDKVHQTLEKIINEGSGGLICIIL